jgi:hypothetical protein
VAPTAADKTAPRTGYPWSGGIVGVLRRYRERDDARMSDHVSLHAGPPETVLPNPPPDAARALAEATAADGPQRRAALAGVAAAHPRFLDAWAALAAAADDPVESYAYARVGYHRGLDALRAAGWRGSGYVRWREPTNRGFLASLDSLRAAAEKIGEADEVDRCATFLHQLDPDWDHRQSPE